MVHRNNHSVHCGKNVTQTRANQSRVVNYNDHIRNSGPDPASVDSACVACGQLFCINGKSAAVNDGFAKIRHKHI